MEINNPRVIAFYLPQFYPTPENDEWWRKGFTEWTNVGNAKPLFKGHYQPRVPADLGYYDLRLPEVREAQADLAKEAGIEGFCYWHYWFAGRRLLDRVFREVVESGKPDFPFCLCWANHSWYAKTWNPDIPDKLLIEQTYPGKQDYIDHFYAMLPAFKDKRYITINGRPLFAVYAPLDIPDVELFISTWNNLAVENGLQKFYFVGFTFRMSAINSILKNGFDAVVIDYIRETYNFRTSAVKDFYERALRKILKIPRIRTYKNYIETVLMNYVPQKDIHPCILPNFDHSPRSAHRGTILINSTPELWGNFCREVFSLTQKRIHEENLVFIKAWNEWGEGNYLEPDLKYGKQYLENLKKEIAYAGRSL